MDWFSFAGGVVIGSVLTAALCRAVTGAAVRDIKAERPRGEMDVTD